MHPEVVVAHLDPAVVGLGLHTTWRHSCCSRHKQRTGPHHQLLEEVHRVQGAIADTRLVGPEHGGHHNYHHGDQIVRRDGYGRPGKALGERKFKSRNEKDLQQHRLSP